MSTTRGAHRPGRAGAPGARSGTGPARSGGPLTGVPRLLPVALHQDARNIGPWVAIISVLSASSIWAYRWLFDEVSERRILSLAVTANPALQLVFGRATDLMTNDGFNAWRAGALGAFFAGLMAILVVVRNTRADEDSGRAELIASGVITRQARLVVAVLMATIAAVALGALCFLLTWLSGGQVVPTLVLAATFTCSALMFAGVAAVAAQLGSDARTASSLAIAVLGVAFLVRGYIDAGDGPDWALWFTPLGWLELTYPATDNNPWPLVPALALAVVLVLVALVLQEHRDFGFGVVAPRPGRPEAPQMRLRGLAWRLHSGTLLTWAVAFVVLGLVWGNLARSVGPLLEANPSIAMVVASGAASKDELSFAYVATVLQLLGLIAAVLGAQVMMRVHAEEIDYRVEPVLATPVHRAAYLGSNVLVALVSTALAMLLGGTLIGLVASRGDTGMAFGDIVLQAAVTIPAVWLLVGVSVATVGAVPSRRIAGWLVIVATFGLTLLGPTFKLPDYLLAISPLHHVPVVIHDDLAWTGLAVVGLIAAALVAAGLAGFRRRDVF